METDGTLNLLLVHDSVEDANRLVSLLRNANYKIDPHYIGSPGELGSKMQERNWDIALVQYAAETVTAKSVFHQIRRLNKDIPVVLISAGYDSEVIVDGLRLGAADVVPMDEDQHMLQVVSRVLYYLDQRRRLRFWKRRYAESESRCEELINSSQDGIAIIQDGTYIQVNDTYANLFGYLDADGMALLPVLDSIGRKSQAGFKQYLKPLSADDAREQEDVAFEGLLPDGSTFPVQGRIAQIEHQGDPALQLTVERRFLSRLQDSGEPEAELDTGSNTGIRLHDMLDRINQAIRMAARTEDTAILHYIRIDRFDVLQRELGIATLEQGVTQLADYIVDFAGPDCQFGRIREDSFVLLDKTNDPDRALTFAEKLAHSVREQVFELDDLTMTCTLSIGLSVISEATSTADGCIERSLKAIHELRENGKHPDVGDGARLFEASIDPSAPDLGGDDIERMGRQMLDRHQLDIAFQPIVPLHGEYAELYEVLMRAKPGALPDSLPDDFVARIFKTEAGKEIDRWIILEAIKALGKKQQTDPNTRLFVNISAATICDNQFIAWLKLALKTAGVTPRDLVFQLREIDVSRHMAKAATMVENLRKIQAGTALTHFGLVINPLDIFHRMTVDFVKMDMLIVEKAQKDEDGVETMMGLINGLKADDQRIVIPFVETASIIPSLWQASVDYIQGHYIQPPAPAMNYEFSEES